MAEPSTRVRVARIALEAALEVDGVSGVGGAGALPPVTSGGGEAVRGAVATAAGDGRYEVVLHLVAEPVPLHRLADRIREQVERRAASAGLEVRLGEVRVRFEDLAVEEPA